MSAPACTECVGKGYVLVACPCCRGQLDGYAEETCARCEGSKVEPCDHCGEPSTHLAYNGDYKPTQPVCDGCEPEEPRGDHPLGGMGYGIDYGSALEAARRLK